MNDNTKSTQTLDDCWNRIGVWRHGDDPCPELKKVIHCRNCPVYSSAGRKILERETPKGYREEWTKILAKKQKTEQQDTVSIIIFRLGDEWLSIPSVIVNEITAAKTIHRLPHTTRNIVKGLVNIRGELHVCISLGRLLGVSKGVQPIPFGSVGISDRMILITSEGDNFVFPVTEVHGLHHHHHSELENAPATVNKSKATYTQGVLPWKQHHISCLNPELLFYTFNKSLT